MTSTTAPHTKAGPIAAPMLSYLADPANAITAVGLALSFLGIYLGLVGRLELGIAAVLWAFLIDHVDGVVARRTPNRAREAYLIGRHLDSLTDLASDCIFPAFVLITVNAYSALSAVIGTTLVIVGALRLGFYNTFGAPGGYYVGVPVTYNVPTVAAVFVCFPIIGDHLFGYTLDAVIIALILLHLTKIKVPVARGWVYAVIAAYTMGVSGVLIARSLS